MLSTLFQDLYHKTGDDSIRCWYSLIIICTLESNLVDLFNESLKPLCLTPEPLLGFQYCFNFLQALFVILEFYFLFDQFFGSFAFLLTQSSSSPSLWPQLYKLIHYSFTQFILHYSDHYLLFP